MDAAIPCKKGTKKHFPFQETEAKRGESNKIPKTKHACIVEAPESTRRSPESSLLKDHEDHIAGKRYNSITRNNLVHKFVPMLQAMNFLDVKAAVDVRGWYIAMGQYSSLCEGAAVLSLGFGDIVDGVPGIVQVGCGREEVNDREKQKKDRTRTNNAQAHIMYDMKMEWSARKLHEKNDVWSAAPVGYSGSSSTVNETTVTRRRSLKKSYGLISNSLQTGPTTMCLKRDAMSCIVLEK